jgi:large subunit ribosomal protein L21
MYAVIRTGGKQYRVVPDQELQIEKIEAQEGEQVEFSEVLMLAKDGEEPEIGTPTIEGARVAAEIVEQGRGGKIIIFKKKRRKNYRRKNGHRQHLTTIRVLGLLGPGEGVASKSAKSSKSKAKAEKAEAGANAEGAKAKKNAEPKQKAAKAKASGFKKLDAPDGEADNLKALPGVGPKLAEKLNEYGIFHYHQLAAMSEDDINEMDEALNLRGRATRDDWVGKAKEMMEE